MGHRVEICAHHQSAPAPAELRFERPLGGFKTGVLGLGHAVLMSENVEDARRFYTGVLGMRLSDYTEKPFDAHFYHVNARHHSFAIIQNKRKGLHHIMLELLEFDDVGQTYDLLDAEGVRLGASLGRHTNDFMTSFYMFTPSEFMIEYGWGGRQIDMKHWQPERLDCGPSFWGHERTWLDEATRREAAELRIAAARRGLKAKVVVTPGHFVEALGEKSS
jgi:2,3-dihydroxybiphenyl 1,2-dioxygenase